jgi:hypothetical protein
MKRYIIPLLLFHLMLAAIGRGQGAAADTIRPGRGQLLTKVLKPGLRQYLVYFQRPQQRKALGFWYWMREIGTIQRGGEACWEIRQRWYGSDSSSYREVYSVNRGRDFAPLYHEETAGGKLSAYEWGLDGVRGADSVEGNSRKGFSLAFGEANFNWNLDIETFEMLPLGEGKRFRINFYDAGLEPPKYVLYKVVGSEEVVLMNGMKIECWKLNTEGESPRGAYSQTFWIGKKTHEFLKEEDSFGGMYRYKVKMPDTAPDIRGRFAGR